MQLHIQHDTEYHYRDGAALVVQALRLWPDQHASQRIIDWQVRVDGRPLEKQVRDGFGNWVATHRIEETVKRLSITVHGSVETHDLHGVWGHTKEALPPAFFLGQSALTQLEREETRWAQQAAGQGDAITRMHQLMLAIRGRVDYGNAGTDAHSPAQVALKLGTGVCQDHAHIMTAMARSLGFPARYVSGYFSPLGAQAAASHAWAEVWLDGLGWVGFDVANRQCPDDRYLRLACGRDYDDAAPLRGFRVGGLHETMGVTVQIAEQAQ